METRSRRRNTVPLARLVAGLAAIGVALFTWRALPPGVTPASRFFFVAALLGGGCGLLGAFAFTHGTAGGYSVLWLASGTYLALALRTLLSVGAVFLAAASLTAFALIRRPTSSGLPWWHPRYLGAGLLAFTVTLWTFFILTLPGNPGG